MFLDEVQAFEDGLAADKYAGLVEDGVFFRRGSGPVLISAPHAVDHYRSGLVKESDMGTGGLAFYLGEVLDASVVVLQFGRFPWEVWDEREDAFAGVLRRELFGGDVGLVVDLHGMSDSHGVDVCVGRGPVPGMTEGLFAERFMDLGTRNRLLVSVDDPFDASPQYTVTNFVQGCEVPAVQIEVAKRFRQVENDPKGFIRAAELIAGVIDEVKGSLF